MKKLVKLGTTLTAILLTANATLAADIIQPRTGLIETIINAIADIIQP